MSRDTVNLIVGAGAVAVGLGLYAGLILAPAWTSYTRLWERVAAGFLSLYVLGVLVGLGIAAALVGIYLWD
jgi:hypothetical protein